MNNTTLPPLDVRDGIAGHWYEGEWFDAITQPFIGSMGEVGFTLFIVFWVGSVSWVFTRSTSMTYVVLMILGGAIAAGLPGTAQVLGFMIMMLITAYALWKAVGRRD